MKILDQETRRLILQLHEKGVAKRKIARLIGHSRPAVEKVIRSGSEEPCTAGKRSVLDEHQDEIQKLIGSCQGNLMRVHEELTRSGVQTGYTTLTDYVRKYELKDGPKLPAGRYHFAPGQEMQFDTSPHHVPFRDGKRLCQCASLVMCYSRMWYIQYYARFTRLECKTFLVDALKYFQHAAAQCMVDNTNVVVLHGTGPDAVMVPEMAAFAERLGFKFIAHRVGDANRSGRVERRFHYVENNFLAGRAFRDFNDLNARAVTFCDGVNHKRNKRLKAVPAELFAAEQGAMTRVPPVMPPVYQVAYRVVDVEGYIHVGGNTYSVPYELIGRQVEIRESLADIRVYDGPREVAAHDRVEKGRGRRITDKRHRPERRRAGRRRSQPLPEEQHLRDASPVLEAFVNNLRSKVPGRGATVIRRLHRMYSEYPEAAFLSAVRQATQYGLTDLARLESMVLKAMAGRLFPNPTSDTTEDRHDRES